MCDECLRKETAACGKESSMTNFCFFWRREAKHQPVFETELAENEEGAGFCGYGKLPHVKKEEEEKVSLCIVSVCLQLLMLLTPLDSKLWAQRRRPNPPRERGAGGGKIMGHNGSSDTSSSVAILSAAASCMEKGPRWKSALTATQGTEPQKILLQEKIFLWES